MKISPENIKKFTPYIVIGGIAGIFGLFVKSKGGNNVSTSNTPSTNPNGNINGTTENNSNQIQNLADQTKTALDNQKTDYTNNIDNQKSFFTNIVDVLQGKIDNNNATILQEKTDSSIALDNQKTYFTSLLDVLQGKLDNSTATISSITSDLHSTQTDVSQNTIRTNKLEDFSTKTQDFIQSTGKTNPPKVATGWVQNSSNVLDWSYNNSNGVKVTDQWVQSQDKKWYYLNAGGNMQTSGVTQDGYTVDSKGAWNDKIAKK